MKNLALALLLAIPGIAQAGTALNWNELQSSAEPNQLILRKKISFEEGTYFHEGHSFQLLEANPLGGIPVYYFELKANYCPYPDQKAEMILLAPDTERPPGRDNSVGIEMEPHCVLRIFVDLEDYPGASLFEEQKH